MLYSHAKQLRLAEIKMLLELRPNWMLTFNSTYQIRSDELCSRMAKCFSALQREYYGRDWASQFDRPWPIAHGYFEHPRTNPHYHVLVNWERRFGFWAESHGQEIWNKFDRQGQLDVREIDSEQVRKVARYCSKDLARYDRFDDIFRYKDTRARTVGSSTLKVGRESGWL